MSIRVTLTDDETETLRLTLEYVFERLDSELQGGPGSFPLRHYAFKLSRRKITGLQLKLFSQKEPT